VGGSIIDRATTPNPDDTSATGAFLRRSAAPESSQGTEPFAWFGQLRLERQRTISFF